MSIKFTKNIYRLEAKYSYQIRIPTKLVAKATTTNLHSDRFLFATKIRLVFCIKNGLPSNARKGSYP